MVLLSSNITSSYSVLSSARWQTTLLRSAYNITANKTLRVNRRLLWNISSWIYSSHLGITNLFTTLKMKTWKGEMQTIHEIGTEFMLWKQLDYSAHKSVQIIFKLLFSLQQKDYKNVKKIDCMYATENGC